MAEKIEKTVNIPVDTPVIPLSFISESERAPPTSLSMIDPSIVDQISDKRFYLSSKDEIQQLENKFVPPKTQASTKWAITVFNSWVTNHNQTDGVEKCPLDLLTVQDPIALNYWLKRFAIEARKMNGETYPPKTLYMLFSGLLRYMRSINPECPNILSKECHLFNGLHNTLDGLFRKLRAEGVGSSSKNAEPFTKDEENCLWKQGTVGIHSPNSLLNAIFFYNGKGCCLRGGEEHRNLKLSQFQKIDNGYIYTENTSKNRSGSFKLLHLENKKVTIMRNDTAGQRCHAYLLDQYIKRLPPQAFINDVFYLRPLMKFNRDDDSIWFTAVSIGRNKLTMLVKEMCKSAGIGGTKSNHSLRATGATELYRAGVPENIIQQRTGHRSLESLRKYEHTSITQHQAVANILSSDATTSYSTQMSQLQSKSENSVSINKTPTMTFSDCTVNITINQ